MIKFNKNTFIGDILCHIYLIILSIIAVFPFIWILLCSVKTNIELTSYPTNLLPKNFTLDNFIHVIKDLEFSKNIGNSVIIALFTTTIAIIISSMAAYGIVRFFLN